MIFNCVLFFLLTTLFSTLFLEAAVNRNTHFFRIDPKYNRQIRNIAKLMAQLKPQNIIMLKAKAMYIKYRSETRGASAKADTALLESIKKEALKEAYQAARNNDEEIKKRQREHIDKLLNMIKEMMKNSNRTFNSTQINK